jgi:formate/nitrite transporter FocA (FNT family)
MKNKLVRFSVQALQWGFVFALGATLAFVQSSSFGQAAQGIAQEMIAIAEWVGIILCMICGHNPRQLSPENSVDYQWDGTPFDWQSVHAHRVLLRDSRHLDH